MRRLFSCAAVLLCLSAPATAQIKETIIPAGTLLPCTLDEPRFSSETALVGDPLLCHVSSLGMFGHPVFPRGAYLSGRLEEFRDPGHFVGKGWLKIEFASLTLPGGTFSLSAKVVSVPHYRVKADGTIRGRGHARRDAIEWSIPLLWPEKLITLPARGPRPELKGEARILLRILEDVAIPADATVSSSASLPMLASPRFVLGVNPGADSRISQLLIPNADRDVSRKPGRQVNSNTFIGVFPRIRYGGVSIPAEGGELPLHRLEAESGVESQVNGPMETLWLGAKPTYLVCKDGRAYLVMNYWVDADQLVYVASDGTRLSLPIEELDFETTARVNRERGVRFEIRSKPTGR